MSVQPVRFRCSCIKTLAAVEASPKRSNQHEFNGVAQLRSIFGTDNQKWSALFSLRGDAAVYESFVTWYEAREAHETRSEFRLYFQTNPVMAKATQGDNIVIGFDLEGRVHCELIPQNNPDYQGEVIGWAKQ